MMRSRNDPEVMLTRTTGSYCPCSVSRKNRPSAMTTLTAGPASATQNSWRGSSGILSSRARPPMGKSVMSRVRMP